MVTLGQENQAIFTLRPKFNFLLRSGAKAQFLAVSPRLSHSCRNTHFKNILRYF